MTEDGVDELCASYMTTITELRERCAEYGKLLLAAEANIVSLTMKLAELEAENTNLKQKIKVSGRTQLREQLAACQQERDELQKACRNVYEVWAGSDGIPKPETCTEDYLLRIVEQMRDEVKPALAKYPRECDHVPVTTFGGDYCIKCSEPTESNNYPEDAIEHARRQL